MISALRNTRNFRCQISKGISTVSQGDGFDFKMFLLNDEGGKMSFWKDLPLKKQSGKFTGVLEIPNNRLAKFELEKEIEFHPIVQDTKKRKNNTKTLRYYAQFPPFNYGFFPQTWENHLKPMPGFDYIGDGDPLDLIEIGEKTLSIESLMKLVKLPFLFYMKFLRGRMRRSC